MGSGTILVEYQARIVALHATTTQLRVGQTIALAVMIVAIAAILLLGFLSIARHTLYLPVALIPVPLVIYSGRLCKHHNSRLLQALRLKAYYERGVDRLEGKCTGPSGEELARPEHCYQKDLHVIGDGSLFQLLCTCRTQVGRRRLAEYLLATPTMDEILERQQAVQELQNQTQLREQISLIGDFSFQEANWGTVVGWLGSPATPVYRAFQLIAVGISASLAILVLLGFASVVAWTHLASSIGALLFLNAAFGLLYRTRVLNSLPAIRSLSLEIGVLREGLGLVRSQHFKSPLLVRLIEAASEDNPLARLRTLERLTKSMTERDKEWFYAFSRALLVGTQIFLLIERWRIQHGKSFRHWLEAWGEFETLMALANYAYEHPDNTFPEFSSEEAKFEAKGIGHPFLSAEICVLNDLSLNAQNRFYIISGSNMAGKSTLLRSIGLNSVLAYSGAPVVAKHLTLSRFTICASLGIQDSLLDGKSKFLAEIDRLKQGLTVPLGQQPVLFLIDEILGGTNSIDRRKVTEAIIKAFIEQGAVGALSTHDLALTELANVAALRGQNVHMASCDDSDPLNFDYILKRGPTTQSSALAIAKLTGLPSRSEPQ